MPFFFTFLNVYTKRQHLKASMTSKGKAQVTDKQYYMVTGKYQIWKKKIM